MSEKKVRVRFAPSPTGPLHIGGVRTALFNYLFAQKHKGSFVLRIEDTDQTRYVEGAEEYIINSMKWAGLPFDEGVGVGGEYGPYRQSERKQLYEKYANQLIASGNAYYAFDTPDELDTMRKRLEAEKSDVQHYGSLTRLNMKNSLTLSETETKQRINSGEPFVIRFKMPENEELNFTDTVRGNMKVNINTLDDKVLFKSDGMPTYHLANVVDDYLMKISHVIRGEEWLPSLPLHVLLYKSFGWEKEMPQFAHLPLILKPDGKGKLSKRDGDRLGFPVFPIDWNNPKTNEISRGYKEWGYFPEAFVNMLAFLGWNPGTDDEILSLKELSKHFSLEKVGKAGAKFDPDKTKWFNQQYLRKLSDNKLIELFKEILLQKNINANDDYILTICNLVKERAVFVEDIWEQASYFFIAPVAFNAKNAKKFWKAETPELMQTVKQIFTDIEVFSTENTEENIKNWIKENELPMGKVLNALRLSLVGESKGPHLFDIVSLLGKNECMKRIDYAIKKLS